VRFGLVAYAAGFFTILVLFDFPITWHLSAWYAPTGILAVTVIVALAVYGYVATLEGRSAFAGLLDT
jgi:hypothetical protein